MGNAHDQVGFAESGRAQEDNTSALVIGIPLDILQGGGELLVLRVIGGGFVGIGLEGIVNFAVGERVGGILCFELGVDEVAIEVIGKEGIVAGIVGQVGVEVAALKLDPEVEAEVFEAVAG
ncbi:MAG: hypothetical protein HC924_14960 [Synechococcaceae cyanobacterium SM2_3_2]|nr:hypothetical protein [Synechococcaceae cyanobacterium SM2_3_2]